MASADVGTGGSTAVIDRRKWLVLGIVAIGQLMVVLDATIVNVALPKVQASLGFRNRSDLAWVLNAYALTFGGFLLAGGRAADRFGRRRIFLVGIAVLGAASVVGGSANSPGVLVAARAVQGLGGALMSPAALSLLTVNFAEGEERNRALGIWAAVAGAGGALGLVLGGVLTDGLSWRWVLYINAPIALLVIAATPRVVKESKDENAAGLNALSAVTVTAALGALVYALVRANDAGWASGQTLGLLLASAALFGVFVAMQARSRNPMLPLRIFRNGTLAGADLGMLIMSAAIVGLLFFLTLYLQEVHGFSAMRTGFSFLPISAAVGTMAQVAPKLMERFGLRAVSVAGMLLGAVGMFLLVRISPGGSYAAEVVPALIVFGAGLGLSFVSLTAAGVAGIPAEDSGVASALVNAAQQVGSALGLAILAAVASARLGALHPAPNDPGAVASATTSSWAWGFGVWAGVILVGAACAAALIRPFPQEKAVAEPVQVPVSA
jgi:EmrB/QacA subfamily drug resistance transporter